MATKFTLPRCLSVSLSCLIFKPQFSANLSLKYDVAVVLFILLLVRTKCTINFNDWEEETGIWVELFKIELLLRFLLIWNSFCSESLCLFGFEFAHIFVGYFRIDMHALIIVPFPSLLMLQLKIFLLIQLERFTSLVILSGFKVQFVWMIYYSLFWISVCFVFLLMMYVCFISFYRRCHLWGYLLNQLIQVKP